jgi:septin family protein
MHENEQPIHKAVRRGNFIPHYLETELDGESVGLTIWDSEGFEKNVVDLQLRELASFVESKFEDTLAEEMKVVRSPGFQDTHVHAVFLVLDPSRLDRNLAAARSMASAHYRDPDDVAVLLPLGHASQGLYGGAGAGALDDDLDLQVVRTLQGKTTVIPVISKADTITTKHMAVLKRSVWDSLKRANLDPLEALGMDEDDDSAIDTSRIDEADEDAIDSRSVGSIPEDDVFSVSAVEERTRKPAIVTAAAAATSSASPASPASPTSPASKRLSGSSIRRHKAQEELKVVDEVPFLPLSIISPDLYEPSVVGRKFPWGFADPYDEKHCDFVRLREAVFHEWRPELREASREQWYEGWRTSRLKGREARR